MDYEKFKEYICRKAEESFEGRASVKIRRCVKNNGIVLDGITIFEKGSNVSPTIYLEGYYKRYVAGENPDKLAGQVLEVYRKNKLDHKIVADFMNDFEKARPALRRRLVNRARNRELLKNLPFDDYLDLAVIWYLELPEDTLPDAMVLVRLDELERWEVSKDEIRDAAELNMKALKPSSIRPLASVINSIYNELASRPDDEQESCFSRMEPPFSSAPPMYVMTTSEHTFGASAMLDTEKLRCLADMHGADIYILPSSVHEVILVPACERMEGRFLSELIWEVNRSEVSPMEVLSDTLYRFDRANGQVVIEIEGEAGQEAKKDNREARREGQADGRAEKELERGEQEEAAREGQEAGREGQEAERAGRKP